jgi:hypothetical protein
MKSEKKSSIGYDETFKILMKEYFGKFAKVITDYEIINLPRNVDLLIIEVKEPIEKHVKLFTYFKRYNIIEFKSIADPFRMNRDLYKIGIYIGGILLKEKKADIKNTTFTLVSSRKPEKFLKYYKEKTRAIKKGLYLIENLFILPIYVVVIEELELELRNDITVLKEFSSGEDRKKFLRIAVQQYASGEKYYEPFIKYGLALYENDIERIIKEENMKMNLMEKNYDKWAEELGFKKKWIEQGMEKGMEKGIAKGIEKGIEQGMEKGMEQGIITKQEEIVLRMKKSGLDIEEIERYTGVSTDTIKSIITKTGKRSFRKKR